MATSWMEQNKALFRALRWTVVTFITIGLIVFVAALNILISLTMMVMEKTKDIAVLIRWGRVNRKSGDCSSRRDLLIGLIGTAIGLVLGYGLVVGGRALPPHLACARGLLHRLRSICATSDGWGAGGAGGDRRSFVATMYPSWSAARILPAEALRYE